MSQESPARVLRTTGETAEVEVTAGEACGGCANAGVCGAFGSRKRVLLARNTARAAVGDRVVVGASERSGALSALAAFGIPGALMLAGVLAGGLILSDTWAGILGGAGLALGALAVVVVDRGERRKGRALPEIVRRLEPGENLACIGEPNEEMVGQRNRARGGDGNDG